MKIVLQRVSEAEARVEGQVTGAIGRGYLVLLCVERGDGKADAAFLAGKVARLRLFPDEAGRFDRSLADIGGAALVVSQFTLAGNWRKGNRPSFSHAAPPEQAEPLYRCFQDHLRDLGIPVETGVFAAAMEVRLVNDGPVTLWLDSAAREGTAVER